MCSVCDCGGGGGRGAAEGDIAFLSRNTERVAARGGRISPSKIRAESQRTSLGTMSDSERAGQNDTDFDSLFVIGEADQSALVAKQQMTYQGSGYNSPNRGSPARRMVVC